MRYGVPQFRVGSARVAFGALTALALLAATFIPAVCQAEGAVSSSTDLKFWGRMAFNMSYDTAKRDGVDFATFLVDDDSEALNFNPRDTRLGFRASSQDGDWKYCGVFEIDFYGDNNGANFLPRMRLGYGEMAHADGYSLRFGQDWVPIGQQNPATMDFGILAYGGNVWNRVPQVTFRYKMDDLELLAGAMKQRLEGADTEKMPWMMARVAYSNFLDGKGTVALGAGFRSVTFENEEPELDDEGNEMGMVMVEYDYSPYVVVGEVNLPFTDQFSLVGEFWTGSSMGGEFMRGGFGYDQQAARTEIASTGGFANLSFKAMPKMTINAGGGIDMPNEDDIEGLGVLFRKNTVAFGNVRHQLSKNFGLGLELMHFITESTELDDDEKFIEHTGQRVTFGTWFNF